MRILVFSHDSTLYGATQSLLTAITAWKQQRLHEVFVLLPYAGPIEKSLTSLAINYRIIQYPRCVVSNKVSFTSFLKALMKHRAEERKIESSLLEIRDTFKPDCVYTNTSVVSSGFLLSARFQLPHVWHVREFGDHDYNLRYLPSRNTIRRRMDRSAHVLFNSRAVKAAWSLATPHQRVIYNGVIDRVGSGVARRLSEGKIRLGVVGGIHAGKGQDVAVDALKILREQKIDCELALYGGIVDTKYWQSLQEKISAFGLAERVILKGFVDDKLAIYNNIDVLLSCAKMEAFGRSIIEAMSYGIPVIANRTGGVVEVISDEGSGVFYDGSSQDLAKAIGDVIDHADKYERLSLSGIRNSAKFTVDEYVKNINQVFNSLSEGVNV